MRQGGQTSPEESKIQVSKPLHESHNPKYIVGHLKVLHLVLSKTIQALTQSKP